MNKSEKRAVATEFNAGVLMLGELASSSVKDFRVALVGFLVAGVQHFVILSVTCVEVVTEHFLLRSSYALGAIVTNRRSD